MNIVYGVELLLPQGKLPGYYAQIVKGIADAAQLLDRDKSLLFVQDELAAKAIETFVSRYQVSCETSSWIYLDESWKADNRIFSDFGVATRSGRHFIDAALGAILAIDPAADDADMKSALLQAQEHAFAAQVGQTLTDRSLLAVPRHQTELIEGIAKAYHCRSVQLY